ncbi:hypothetical protein H4R22_002989, partial [Coemansia sp. RSA 1290]
MLKHLLIGLIAAGEWMAAADDIPFGAASVVVYKFGQNRIASDSIQYPQETTANDYSQPCHSSYQPQPSSDYPDVYNEPEYKHSTESSRYYNHCTSDHYPPEDSYRPADHSEDYNYREPQYKNDHNYVEPEYSTSKKPPALGIGPDPNNPLAPYLLPTDHTTYSSSSDTSNIYAELKDARIIPDVLPSSFTPQFDITIKFNGEAIEMGQMLTIDETKTEPIIEFDAPYGQIFTIAIVDPDAPSNTRHGYRSYRHFLISNLGSDNSGDKLTAYRGPYPSYGSGTHRYVVLVFKQQDYVDVDAPHSRVRFDAAKWGAQHHMTPVAASYFTVK